MRALLALLLIAAPGAFGQDAPLAITHVTVVDVETGDRLPGHTVLVEADRITAVGPSAKVAVPEEATVLDGTGQYLLPGFADMHVHLYTEADLLLYVANGVTTVRNMAGNPVHLALREGTASGALIGPRIVTAGPPLEGEPPSRDDHVVVTDPAAVRAAVLRQRAAGYDLLKVYNRMAPAVYDSALAVAAEVGMPVAGHVPFEVGLDGALAAGQGSIEHLRGYVHALVPPTAPVQPGASFRDRSVAWLYADTTRLAEVAARTRTAGVWNVPTLAFTAHELAPAAEHARLLARPETRYLRRDALPDRAATSYLADFSEDDFADTQRGLGAQFALVRALDAAGAGLLVGTDSWLGGFAYADELALLVGAGLSPARVLRMATLDAARFLDEADEWGVIAPGQRADLVLVDADPLADIAQTRRIHAVVLRGQLLNRAALDAMLARAETASAAGE